MIKVLFFGQLADITGVKESYVDRPGELGNILSELTTLYPDLKRVSFKTSLNKTIVNDLDQVVHAGAEVALFPPFSGG